MEKETTIDPTKTALVVIDLQKGIVGREIKPYAAADVVSRSAQLADAFRKHGAPVFLVHVSPTPDGKDALKPKTDAPPMNMKWEPDWADFVPEMGPKEGDFVIIKRQWGAFTGTELDLQMRRRGIDTIVLCGIATDIGVESTARFAFEYGYNQIFAEDAMGSMSEEQHMNSVKGPLPRMGIVRSTEEILKALG